MIKLPDEFIVEMTELWQKYSPPGNLKDFLNSFSSSARDGLLLNKRKIKSLSDIPNLPDERLSRVPWTDSGYFLPLKHNYSGLTGYRNGLFYLQDPSAMLPAELAAVKPGEKVLDMCAAPGGKTFRIISELGESGLVHANELSDKRARALSRNVELSGSAITFITCGDALDLREKGRGTNRVLYDVVLLDVPCTGSAMFRKDSRALKSWSRYRGKDLLKLQSDLLSEAAKHLRPGGRIVYSTCSFSYDENEAQVQKFLSQHPTFSVEQSLLEGVSPGLSLDDDIYGLRKCHRIWPHISQGEGQFVAVLYDSSQEIISESDINVKDQITKQTFEALREFLDVHIKEDGPFSRLLSSGEFILREQEGKLHLQRSNFPLTEKMYYMKTGLFLGTIVKKKNKPVFEPSQAFLLHLTQEDLSAFIDCAEGVFLESALRGDTITLPHIQSAIEREELKVIFDKKEDISTMQNGQYLVLGYFRRPLLWLKKQDQYFKNEYPKSWIR